MAAVEYVAVGNQEAWLLVDGEQVVATIIDDGDEFVAMPMNLCAQTLNDAAVAALVHLGCALGAWPSSLRAAFETQVAMLATHPDDWEQW